MLSEVVDELEQPGANVQTWVRPTHHLDRQLDLRDLARDLDHDSPRRVVGTVMITGPEVGSKQSPCWLVPATSIISIG